MKKLLVLSIFFIALTGNQVLHPNIADFIPKTGLGRTFLASGIGLVSGFVGILYSLGYLDKKEKALRNAKRDHRTAVADSASSEQRNQGISNPEQVTHEAMVAVTKGREAQMQTTQNEVVAAVDSLFRARKLSILLVPITLISFAAFVYSGIKLAGAALRPT